MASCRICAALGDLRTVRHGSIPGCDALLDGGGKQLADAGAKGALLWNRLLWTAGVQRARARVRHLQFHDPRTGRRRNESTSLERVAEMPSLATSPRRSAARASTRSRARPIVARTRLDVQQVFKSPGFAVLLVLGLLARSRCSHPGLSLRNAEHSRHAHMIAWLSGPFDSSP